MYITYSSEKNISKTQLKKLYESVNWESGKYPERLSIAISNYSVVYTAWNNCNLIGLISVLDDGELNAYIHYLLVNPQYHNIGIGSALIEMVKSKYSSYINLILISYKNSVSFYTKLGFEKDNEAQAMYFIP